MYGIFMTENAGEMIWLATVDTEEQANIVYADKLKELQSEECLMILPLHSFYQEV